jgi:hypothetical protein
MWIALVERTGAGALEAYWPGSSVIRCAMILRTF